MFKLDKTIKLRYKITQYSMMKLKNKIKKAMKKNMST